MNHRGILTDWDDKRGFGFIESEKKRVFVHISAFSGQSYRPRDGDEVIYTLGRDQEGRRAALTAKTNKRPLKLNAVTRQSITLACLFIAIIAVLGYLRIVPYFVLYLYLAMSALTYLMYLEDKKAAQSGRWRTSEKRLHFLSMAGGWPGAMIAQQHLRHKCAKTEFRIVYILTILINCYALGSIIFTDSGKELLIQAKYYFPSLF